MLKRTKKSILALGFSVMFFVSGLAGVFAESETPLHSLVPRKKIDDQVTADKEYVLKGGDKINLIIYPADEYIRGGAMQISPNGMITLPLIGQIEIMGLHVTEAQEKIAKLLNEDYLVNPNVVIEISQFKQQSFVILGQVKTPGTFQFPAGENRLSFLQAISIAGGFSEIANIKKIKIIREANGKKKVIRVNAEKIISGKDPDIDLEPNDIIHVSESLF